MIQGREGTTGTFPKGGADQRKEKESQTTEAREYEMPL